MNIFKSAVYSVSEYTSIQKACNTNTLPVLVTGVSAVHKAQLAFALSESAPVLVIAEDEASALRFSEDINEMAGEQVAFAYPAKDFVFTEAIGVSREYEHKRIEVLSRILSGDCRIVTASAEAALQLTIPKENLKNYTITLKKDTEIAIPVLIEKLIGAGYSRAPEKVEGVAQFAVRGSIVDIFPVQMNSPVRIEFWGDTIDEISHFNTETQRRDEKLYSVEISPALETIADRTELVGKIRELAKTVRGKTSDITKEKLLSDAEILENGAELSSIDKYITLCGEPTTIFDYVSGLVCVSEIFNINDRLKGVYGQYCEDMKILLEGGNICRKLSGYMLSPEEFSHMLDISRTVYLDTFMRGGSDVKFRSIINIPAHQTSGWGGEMRQLTEDLRDYCDRGYCVILLAGSEKTLPIICDDLRESGIKCVLANRETELTKGCVLLMTGCTSGGFDYPDSKVALISQTKLRASRKKLKKHKKSEEIKSLSDIATGDLVVHIDYGIGEFSGIEKIEFNGVTKDYICIKYAGTDKLYVPVTSMDLISKYIGVREGATVKLNKLSGNAWQKTRARVKTAVKDMADELIALYAKRSATKGYAFEEDDDLQHDFDSRFEYDETDDQLRAIAEIKEDMQKPIPMDRLLCGDVGFGKTEVAFRGVFKCVEEHKQCAILVPTTVLAWQHYQTALKRFEHFPVNIELLSRFRTPKQQKEILGKLETGEIDVIIGTHRLVQKDVKFNDLGLAIIDEEQRFGVAHKEKFKEMFAGVDILTLSATPIPRTLNMAMSGIRDMSVIEEPPQDRHPVQTYVIEHNDSVIIQAIFKELRRGGQVYYIHNHIDTIHSCAAKILEQLPDARIGIAHGRMNENELSDIWKQLVDHEIDILVCTTLIETGVDVPNCNTLIIEDADKMGLSQLYQLRGRVGRSNRRAFAYFMFRRGKVLSEIAARRLDAIREFTQFGSGFRIALRDLEIRGAGSFLGGKQHGHMEAVGYDMYMQLLSEAVAEQRGVPLPEKPAECRVDIQIDTHIPEKYIENLAGRLDVYKKIATVHTVEEETELLEELDDRYGVPPGAIKHLIRIALIRNQASKLGITEIKQKKNAILFYLTTVTEKQLPELLGKYKSRVFFNDSPTDSYISVKLSDDEKNIDLMEEFINLMTENA